MDGPPGPSGDGGSGGDSPGPTASGATWDPATGTWRGPVWRGTNDPFLQPGGAGIRPGARGGGGASGIKPCGATKAKGLEDSGNVVFFLSRDGGFGPIVAGHKDDKHQFQKTKDDQGINSGHLSVDALWYRDQKKDGPMDFAHFDYPKPNPLPNISRVHLVWDPGDQHKWARGSKDGKWKWFAELPDFPSPGAKPPTTGPPPPPPTKPPAVPPGDTTPPPTPPPTTPSTPTTPDGPTTGGGGDSGGGETGDGGGDSLPPGWTRAGDGGAIDPQGHWHASPPDSAGGGDGEAEGGGDSAEGGSGEGGTVTPTPSTSTPPVPPPPETPPCGGGTTPPGSGAPGHTTPGTTGGGGGEDGETDNKDGEGGGFGDDTYYGGPGGFVPGMPTFPGGPGTQDGWTPSCHPVFLASFVGPNPRPQGGVQRATMQRNLATGFASMHFRPQTMQPGQQDYRFSVNIDRRAQNQDDAVRPTTARLEAFGAGQVDFWEHNVAPGDSQYRGGEAAGGAVFLPPYVDISDHEDDFDLTDEGQPADPAYLVMGPNTCFAFGAPDLGTRGGGAGGGVKEGAVVVDQMAATTPGSGPVNDMAGIQIQQIDSTGAPVLLISSQHDESSGERIHVLEGEQSVRIPRGPTVARPAAPVGGELRSNMDVAPGVDTIEHYDAQLGAWTQLGGGGGGGNQLLDGAVHTDTTSMSPDATGVIADVIGTDGAGSWVQIPSAGGPDLEVLVQPPGGGPAVWLPMGRSVPGDDLVPVGTAVVAAGAPGAGWTAAGAVSGPMNAWAGGLGAPFSFFEKL